MRAEYLVDAGYYNQTHRIPSKEYKDWMKFIQNFVTETVKELVEITHKNGVKTVYSNLSGENLVTVGTKLDSGAKIGCVGDSAISELADEPHLHFEVIVNEASVNPLDYISEDAKRTSLGIAEENAA